ncbi:Differentially expressed in FDCP 6 homolog [Geodia barretti]|uniref:Differentially expressed in FDCP 6 homolog n=1 Tax=Geodia barretti TaxID=519541 RepID=A0AA35TQ35_GEOBA|nr:Differentially expressed in FDCP 6 homolog [Geodia barretti]
METSTKEYIVRNCLTYAYGALRSKDRLMGESTVSHYENYFQQLLEELGPPGKKWETAVPNSEVESFYLGNTSLGEFRLHTQKRVFTKVPGWEFAPFSSVIWSITCSSPDKTSLCSKLDPGLSRQIWEIFVSLDVDSQVRYIHVYKGTSENASNKHTVSTQKKICDAAHALYRYARRITPNIIRSLHELVFSEILLCGKLTKKGHKIPSWKERWFTLQPKLLTYYESYENMVLKVRFSLCIHDGDGFNGMIAIGADTQFEFMADSKSHQRRFKIVDHQTQVPYEICTPDVSSLQKWNYGIQVAVTMNRVSGSNFLYKLTQAQKQIFPENATFAISAVTHTKSTKPPGFGYHPPLSPSKSVPQPPMPYNKHKAMAGMHHQSSIPDKLTPYGDDTDGPPPIPLQNFDTAAAARENQLNIAQRKSSTGSGVVVREKPRDSASRGIREAKSRRRHSSINQSSEFEKEQEKREKDWSTSTSGVQCTPWSKNKVPHKRPS